MFGASYVRTYLEVGLPSQFAPGNLPALVRAGFELTTHIFTTPEDIATLEQSPVFQHLRDFSKVVFHDITGQVREYRAGACSCFDIMNRAYQTGMKAAYADHGALVAIWPDVVFSDGSFAVLGEHALKGTRCVVLAGNQAHVSLAEDLRARFLDPAGIALPVPARELLRSAMAHFTPYWTQYFVDDPCFPSQEATHFQKRVGASGFLTRTSYFHPIYIRPTAASLEYDLTNLRDGLDTSAIFSTLTDDMARDIHVVTDSDEMCFVGLDGRVSSHFGVQGPMNLTEMALALMPRCRAHTPYFFRQPLRFHVEDLDESWTSAQVETEAVVEQILACVQLWQRHPQLLEGAQRLQRMAHPSANDSPLFRHLARFVDSLSLDWILSRKRIGIYGAGAWSRRLLQDSSLRDCNIVGVFDTNPAMHGRAFLAWTLSSPEQIRELSPEVILVIAEAWQDEIQERLRADPHITAEIIKLFPAVQPKSLQEPS